MKINGKKALISALCMITVLALAACGSTPAATTGTNDTTAAQTSETTEAAATTTQAEQTEQTAAIDYSALSEEEVYELMIKRAVMSEGNTERLKKVFTKAKNGEEITVAYIGGSITEGISAGSELCWARLSYNWLCEKFPTAKINYVNAGMSGTPSVLGNIRSERDLLPSNPDLVFVEFAVNDGQDSVTKQSYEALVKRTLLRDNDPAVMLLFTVLKNGYTAQEYMSKIGENYELPMLCMNSVLQPEFDSGRMTWEKYSDDESHPNIWGHQLVCDIITDYWESVIADLDNVTSGYTVSETPVFGDNYLNMHFTDRLTITPESLGSFTEKDQITQFPNGWQHREGNEPITFKLTCSNLFVIARCQNSEKFGKAEVYVDGELTGTVNTNLSDGWNNPVATPVYTGSEVKEHTVEIKMTAGDEDKYFGLLGFGYTD